MKTRSDTRHLSFMRDIQRGRLIKFATVGFSGTLINLAMLYSSQEYIFRWIESFERRLTLSLVCAILLATLNNFMWNRGWTWGDRKEETGHRFFPQMGQYFLASGFAIGFQYLSTMSLSKVVHYVLANLFSIGIAALLNYIVNDVWTFAVRKDAAKPAKLKATSV